MATVALVSLCIPTFDHVRFLPEALALPPAQTCPDIEIVALVTDTARVFGDSHRFRAPDRVPSVARNDGPGATPSEGKQPRGDR